MNDRQYQKFVINELIRFWESQEPFAKQTYNGRRWLEETLKIWTENSRYGRMGFAYKEAVRRINESKPVNP